jgi:hypothetical protein
MKRARNAKRMTKPTAPAGSGAATVVVPSAAPRNPFVAHAHRRRAGAHGGSARKRRQAEKKELRKLLED